MRKPPIITADTPFGPDVDLEKEDIRLPSGRRLTNEVVEEFIEAAHALRGRPSLSAAGTRSPTVTVRLPVELNDALTAEAERTGRRRSDIVREALQARLAG